MVFKKKLHLLNPNKPSIKIEYHKTKREIREKAAKPISIEHEVRKLLSRRISGRYLGLWLLIPEHLRLGSWDIIKSWSKGNDNGIEPRLSMQMVHESALCINGLRHKRSLCHQGFEVLNGLPFIATDKSIHDLLESHTVSESQLLQIALAKLRRVKGHYNSGLFALDPHRIETYSNRVMPAKKSNRRSKSKKVMQIFFSVDAISGQPLGFTIGSSAVTTGKATLELLEMMELALSTPGFVLADSEHATSKILSAFSINKQFDILMPMPRTGKIKEIIRSIKYENKWAGYALGETEYTMKGVNSELTLIVQRSGEVENEYEYKPFITTGKNDSVKILTEDYPERWTIEEFFNFEAAMGWNRASTMNLNIRYGKMSHALISQAVTYELRKKLPKPYRIWTAKHLSDTLFQEIEGDVRVKDDTIIVTYYNFPKEINIQKYYENLPEKLLAEGVDPRVPWLYNFKVDFRFK
jgi:hypothetical protein